MRVSSRIFPTTVALFLITSVASSVVVRIWPPTVHPQQQKQHVLDMPSKILIDDWIQEEASISLENIVRNIHPPGTVRGFVAASPSRAQPDYFYSWTRDAGLVMRVLAARYNVQSEHLFHNYVDQEVSHQEVSTPCNCLGEPKFNADGSSFEGSWGRPQNDGPAIRAATFIALTRLATTSFVHHSLMPALFRDLDYVANVWDEPCFDLWEEVCGVHFYTLMVMRRAMLDGAVFAETQGHLDRHANYSATADMIADRLETFWTGSYYTVTQDFCEPDAVFKHSGIDVANILAANHAGVKPFTPGSDKILATAYAVETAFDRLYPLNEERPLQLGTSIGRYPEDTYDGYKSGSLGNPWFLATTGMAELYYRAIHEWTSDQATITVNTINAPFLAKILGTSEEAIVDLAFPFGSPMFDNLVERMADAADRFMATVKSHQRDNGSLSEQFHRSHGFEQGARDLTWSYAAFISAADARAGHPIP